MNTARNKKSNEQGNSEGNGREERRGREGDRDIVEEKGIKR